MVQMIVMAIIAWWFTHIGVSEEIMNALSDLLTVHVNLVGYYLIAVGIGWLLSLGRG